MTTQNILVLVGIVSVFATFGIVVAWADFYSRGYPKPANEEPAAAQGWPPELAARAARGVTLRVSGHRS